LRVPLGMFSVAQTMPITLTFGLSMAMARMAPIMAAPPAISYFIFSIPSAGLMEMPPVSNVTPLPTRPSTGFPARLAVHNASQSGEVLLLSLGHAPERAHLHFFDFVRTVKFALQANGVAQQYFCCRRHRPAFGDAPTIHESLVDADLQDF